MRLTAEEMKVAGLLGLDPVEVAASKSGRPGAARVAAVSRPSASPSSTLTHAELAVAALLRLDVAAVAAAKARDEAQMSRRGAAGEAEEAGPTLHRWRRRYGFTSDDGPGGNSW